MSEAKPATSNLVIDCLVETLGQLARTIREVGIENDRLKAAIRKHRDEKGHDRCHLDDAELYAVLGEPIPERPLPCREEFLSECERFWEKRQSPTPKGPTR